MKTKTTLLLLIGLVLSILPALKSFSWLYVTIRYDQESLENMAVIYDSIWFDIPHTHPYWFGFLPIIIGLISLGFLCKSIAPYLKAKSNNFLDLYSNALLSFPLLPRPRHVHRISGGLIIAYILLVITSASTAMCLWWLM